MTPNIDDTITFLTALEPDAENHEFFWYSEHATKPRKYGYSKALDAAETLVHRNKGEYNIFMVVNAIDVPNHDDGYPRRRAKDITRVRAVFGDFDDPSVALPEFGLEPSMVVETSPGKHHVYWITRDTPLGAFSRIQTGIIDKYAASGSDKSIKDLSRVMRVPGFLHMKDPANPFLVRLLNATGVVHSYEALNAEFPSANVPQRLSGPLTLRPPTTLFAELALAVAQENGVETGKGRYVLECPWADTHSDGRREAMYFSPSNHNGGRGGFKCMHAHCADKGIQEFAEFSYQLCKGEPA